MKSIAPSECFADVFHGSCYSAFVSRSRFLLQNYGAVCNCRRTKGEIRRNQGRLVVSGRGLQCVGYFAIASYPISNDTALFDDQFRAAEESIKWIKIKGGVVLLRLEARAYFQKGKGRNGGQSHRSCDRWDNPTEAVTETAACPYTYQGSLFVHSIVTSVSVDVIGIEEESFFSTDNLLKCEGTKVALLSPAERLKRGGYMPKASYIRLRTTHGHFFTMNAKSSLGRSEHQLDQNQRGSCPIEARNACFQ
jgi:hypothetical protein